MEIKDLQKEIQTSFEQLKAAGERQEAEIKKFGQASKETEGVIANINSEINSGDTQGGVEGPRGRPGVAGDHRHAGRRRDHGPTAVRPLSRRGADVGL